MTRPARHFANETKATPAVVASPGSRAPRRGPGTGKAAGAAVLARRALVGAAVVLLAMLGVATGASAHAELSSSTPKDGATVATVPADVTLTMTENVVANYSFVEVKDAAGTNWANGPVRVVDNVVTQPLREGAPAGTYAVAWRVLSVDGHNTQGTFSFTATGAGSGAAAGAAKPLQTTNEPRATPAPNTPDVPWSVIGLIAVLVILAVALIVLARRRLGNED
ncbi:copper resistance CopC family protein [Specibacter cremeus]|uniref:copper resistance CopC family protein n=1 Tax=Specibacter cremeus TaxID=1629051 RepID=UPI001F0C8D1B|nr:copper resistance CopC family protein [Specibacter cremeus]